MSHSSGIITGREVRRVRKVLGLSQQKLAALLNMSTITISRWEGEKASPDGYGEVVISLLLALDSRAIAVEDVLRELRVSVDRMDVVVRLVHMVDRVNEANVAPAAS